MRVSFLAAALLGSTILASNLSAEQFLRGPWKFKGEDRPEFSEPGFDDSTWKTVKLPSKVDSAAGVTKFSGAAWYRLRIRVPEGDFALFFPNMAMAAEVYVQGEHMAEFGRIRPPADIVWPVPHLVPIGRRDGDLLIAVRVWSPDFQIYGPVFAGILSTPLIGSPSEMKLRLELSRKSNRVLYYPQIGLNIVFVAIGLLLLVISIRQTERAQFLGFSLTIMAEGATWITGISPIFNESLSGFLVVKIILLEEVIATIGITFLVTSSLENPWRWRRIMIPILLCSGVPGILLDRYNLICAIVLSFTSSLAFFAAIAVQWKHRDRRSVLWPLLALCALNIVPSMASNIKWMVTNVIPFYFVPVRFGDVTLFIPSLISLSILSLAVIANIRKLLKANRQQLEIEAELRSARQIQEYLAQSAETLFEGFSLEIRAVAAKEVGGDFHQVIRRDDESIWILIGDVSGKGLSSAIWASMVVGAFRDLVWDCQSPSEGLSRLNRSLSGLPPGLFVTALLCRIHRSGSVLLANAGHLLPFMEGDWLEVTSGPPLGLLSSCTYPEHPLTLLPGQRIVFVTDGLVEARDVRGQLLGFPAVGRMLAAGNSLAQLEEAAVSHGLSDDLTIVEVRHGAKP